MKTQKPSVHNILLAAAFALPLFAVTSAARADDMDGGRPPMMHGGPEHAEHGPGGFGHGFGPGPRNGMRSFGGFGGFGGSPVLRGVELTEAQQDKVFAILHDQAPYLRDQAKAAAKAHEALRALSTSDKYDDAKAASLAQAGATAMANITLQHVRTDQKLLALLTPEQRKKQAEEKPRHWPRR
jgi:Spy/CpxP family protein refolding chaperone